MPDSQLILDGKYTRLPFAATPELRQLLLSADAQRAWSFLFGWDAASGMWRPVLVTAAGALGVMAYTNYGDSLLPSQVTVTAAATKLCDANTLRRRLLLKNAGAEAVYVGGSSAVTITTGYPVLVGDTLDLGYFLGAVYAITGTGSSTVGLLEAAVSEVS